MKQKPKRKTKHHIFVMYDSNNSQIQWLITCGRCKMYSIDILCLHKHYNDNQYT